MPTKSKRTVKQGDPGDVARVSPFSLRPSPEPLDGRALARCLAKLVCNLRAEPGSRPAGPLGGPEAADLND